MTELSKKPDFIRMPPQGDVITEFALQLIAYNGDSVFASGTAVIIAPNLALTAKHVILDFVERYGHPGQETKGGELQFSIDAVHQIPGSDKLHVWMAKDIICSAFSDHAILYLEDKPGFNNEKTKWTIPIVDLTLPAVGDRVVGFGYPRSVSKIIPYKDSLAIHTTLQASTTVGEITEVHEEFRDSAMMTFPCYRTNARIDGGMSGGPVFSNGRLKGIMCQSMDSGDGYDDHVSYVAMLWPLTALININYPPAGGEVSFVELAGRNIVHAPGWEHVRVYLKEDGDVECVEYKKNWRNE